MAGGRQRNGGYAKSTIARKARSVTRKQASNLARSKGFGGKGG